MGVIYSVGFRLGGSGAGAMVYHGASALDRHGLLARLLCGSYVPTDLPDQLVRSVGLPSRVLRKLAAYDGSKRLQLLHSALYDLWASHHLAPAELLLTWGADGLRSIGRARELGIGAVVQIVTAHPAFRAELMTEENRRWGIQGSAWLGGMQRIVQEIALADYALVPSDFSRETCLAHGVPDEKIVQAPFGVDVHRFRPAAARAKRPFRVVFVGRIELGKGIPYLLEAWRKLGWRDAELVLVGRLEPAYVHLYPQHSRGVANLRLVGFVRDPVPYYQEADLFVLPTLHEGSALVTYEALACGLPCITTPNAGSVVRDGQEGLLVPIRSVDALASAMERLREDELLRKAMSQAARRRAEAYSWTASGDALARTLAGLIAERRQGEL